jgi:putative ABC transport system substrate-binding protein
MKRREFIGLVGGAAALPLATRAQERGKVPRIGVLNLRTGAVTTTVMRPAWERLGYVEGETVLLRAAEGDGTRFPKLVADLIGAGAGVLIVVGAQALQAATKTTSNVPIVAIDLETDPVRAGLAVSIARPGRNVTGLFLDLPSLAGKWIEFLLEIVAGIERVALSWDPTTGTDQLDVATRAARSLGLQVAIIEAGISRDFEEAIRPLADGKRTGLIQLSSPGFGNVAGSFAAAAQKYRLPTVAYLPSYARAGVLLSYGPKEEEYFPRAVIVADKILHGASPADLPIERPAKFELAINLKTAKALGIAIPPALLARADEMIE